MCLRQYGLDPAHYYTSPGLSWDALLKKTGVVLELLTDYDQHLFIEKGTRGGISMVSKRHAKANNHLVDGYNPEKPSSHILYLDANNLYGRGHEPAITHERLPVDRRLRAAGQSHCRSSSRRSRGLYTRGGPGVPRRASRRAQCISADTGSHGGSEKVDVGVSAQPPGRWGGADRG